MGVGCGPERSSHDLGNISAYLGKPTGLEDYSAGWGITSIRPSHGKTLSGSRFLGWPDGDQRDPRSGRCAHAVRFGADGIVVSNHGGRQLTVYSLPLVRCPLLQMR